MLQYAHSRTKSETNKDNISSCHSKPVFIEEKKNAVKCAHDLYQHFVVKRFPKNYARMHPTWTHLVSSSAGTHQHTLNSCI